MTQNAGLRRRHLSLELMFLLTAVFAGTRWSSSSHDAKQISFAGSVTHRQSWLSQGWMKAVDVAAKRRGCTAREAIGIFYATQTGNTETVASLIAERTGADAVDVGEISAEDLAGYDGLIVGCPTWNTGADEYRSGTAWDDLLDDIRGTDLAGKPVAVFGCGDSQSYADNFCDGIEELHETFTAAGAKMVGYADAVSYKHSESKSVRADKFLGLPLDQDNEDDMTEARVKWWIDQIKEEGMPL